MCALGHNDQDKLHYKKTEAQKGFEFRNKCYGAAVVLFQDILKPYKN